MALKPNHNPTPTTRARVEALVSFGTTFEQIAQILDISTDTLTRHYRKQLDLGQSLANERVAGALFSKAVHDGDVTAQTFWLKTRGKWRTADAEAATKAQENTGSVVMQLIDKINPKEKDDAK